MCLAYLALEAQNIENDTIKGQQLNEGEFQSAPLCGDTFGPSV